MPITPALFLGHGNPMHALANNPFTQAWNQLGHQIPRPRAILAISAHWYGTGTAVTIATSPRTIHDFRGFPPELYQITYPAPGEPALAARIQTLLAPRETQADPDWGLDHGTWAVLRHVYPQADIPIVQLRIDARLPPAEHLEIGRRLAPLRQEGVLILGSGNLVHNLRLYAWGQHAQEPYEWALRFEESARAMMQAGDLHTLAHYTALGPDAARAIPTPEHFLPLLYVLATRAPGDRLEFPVEGMEGGSISMLAVSLSPTPPA